MMEINWIAERLETNVFNEATIEHLHRYAIARDYIRDKNVLDLACGEGYGAALLAQDAKSVSGVDIDTETVLKAQSKYKRENLKFVTGKAEMIPFADNSFDVVISFETIEHTADHQKVISEFKRVLKSGGLLILSTPEKKNYSDKPQYQNPFHLKELYENELKEILSRNFKNFFLLHQRLILSSLALSEEESRLMIYQGDYKIVRSSYDVDPIYLIAFSSDEPIPKPGSSIFRSTLDLQTALDEKERSIKSTISYKIGHNLLLPMKWIRKQFNNKRYS